MKWMPTMGLVDLGAQAWTVPVCVSPNGASSLAKILIYLTE